jgi:hypothetical protein
MFLLLLSIWTYVAIGFIHHQPKFRIARIASHDGLGRKISLQHSSTIRETALANMTLRPDNFLEKKMLFKFATLIANVCTDKDEAVKLIRPDMSYEECVAVTKVLMKKGTAEELENKVLTTINSLIPKRARESIRRWITRYPKFFSQLSAWWLKLGWLHWLVGPVERMDIKVPTVSANGSSSLETWKSGVQLTKCRYLAEVKCKSACIHLCKAPTQAFFKELGLNMYMKPNFEDYSCELQIGVPPPSVEEDPAYNESCYSDCDLVKPLRSCEDIHEGT